LAGDWHGRLTATLRERVQPGPAAAAQDQGEDVLHGPWSFVLGPLSPQGPGEGPRTKDQGPIKAEPPGTPPPPPSRRAAAVPVPRRSGRSRPRPGAPAARAALPSRRRPAGPGSAARTPAPPACASAPAPAPAIRRRRKRSSRTARE